MGRRTRPRYALSRRRRRLIALAVVLAAAAIGFVDRRCGSPLRQTIAHWGPDWSDYHRYHERGFTVINVVDGDTLDVDLPDGTYPRTRVRLLGIDTPEKANGDYPAMYYGQEATEFARGLAQDKQVVVLLDTVGDVRDKYGRLLAYVRLPDGRVLNEEVLRCGYGYADLRFRHSRFDEYVQLQQQAMDSGAGLWKDVTFDQLPRWLQRERPGLLQGAQLN